MADTFGKSAYLTHMHSPAPPEAVAGEVAKILSILGESDFAFAVELAKTPVNLSVLSELIMWNKRLASDPHRDRISKAGNLFGPLRRS